MIDLYYPELGNTAPEARAGALLAKVAAAAAHLTARWMTAGFVHGVLNTDNMNITGESFDYGPYRFLPRNDPNFVAAYFDQTGLYSFGRQPEAVFWNLQQLAGALTLVSETEPLVEALNGFSPAYRDELRAAMLHAPWPRQPRRRRRRRARQPRLPHPRRRRPGPPLGALLLRLVLRRRLRTPRHGRPPRRPTTPASTRPPSAPGSPTSSPIGPERLQNPYFARAEPEELLIDEIEALWAAIAERDDWGPFSAKLEAIEAARVGWGLGA